MTVDNGNGRTGSRDSHTLIWMAGFVIFSGLLYLLSEMLAPFVAGLAVAYFFDPLADRLEETGASRGAAAGIIVLSFLAGFILLSVLLFPLLQTQVLGLFERIPALIENVRNQVQPFVDRLNDAGKLDDLKGAAESYISEILSWTGGVLKKILSGGIAFFNVISLIVITPLVAFYLLRDWDRMVARFDELLPRRQADTIREQFRAIDKTVAAFVRGQGLVCLVLGIFYAVGLTLAGLDFGLLVGLGTGAISFIPYVGAGIGMLTGVAIAIGQYSDWMNVAIVAAIFFAGQTAESYFLTPRLVGESVGLHPVWIIFALLAGGTLFGFTGVLLAVPVTAVIGVLVRFFIARYLESPLYGKLPKG